MRELKNHPSPNQLDSYDKYPCYYENDLELVYTPQQSIFTLWKPVFIRRSGRSGRTTGNGHSRQWDLVYPYRPWSERFFLHLPDRKRWKMAGRNTRYLGKSSRHQWQSRCYNRLERDESRRLGIRPVTRTENVFRYHSLWTSSPRF